ncbi:hypothetical protein QO003_001689 [Arthrobacter silviterrae]|uniref:IS4 family transposase n=1 Tax=Arthrobacter silviterrae TaxID=2026658 RepID=A0ABX0DIQ7_9MICC|nr:IS4 family transposase [Arthrobacter silviterrae]MDQ0277386.1 hypothetical protein [Arthrobacter silviterrae]NGN85254.1 IS4 family transposase [Arthrobacter silviterrae]
MGELTVHLPAELVDEALTATLARERRIRSLPSRVVVYFVLALALFPELGYRSVLGKLCLGSGVLAGVSASALSQARRRVGVGPLRWIFEILRGPAPTITGDGSWFGALRVCALDGTILSLPDTGHILAKYSKQAGLHGGTGYPQARVVALVACGTRSIIDAVFGPTRDGETTQTPALLPSMGPGMIVLADRNFAAAALLHRISDTGAHYLVRVKNARNLLLTVALFDDGAATGFDDGPGVGTPRRVGPGGAFVVMVAAWSSWLPVGYSLNSLTADCAADWSTIALFAERVAMSAARARLLMVRG